MNLFITALLAFTLAFASAAVAETEDEGKVTTCWNDSECAYDRLCECPHSSPSGHCDSIGICVRREHAPITKTLLDILEELKLQTCIQFKACGNDCKSPGFPADRCQTSEGD